MINQKRLDEIKERPNNLAERTIKFLKDYLADHLQFDHEGIEHESYKDARELLDIWTRESVTTIKED